MNSEFINRINRLEQEISDSFKNSVITTNDRSIKIKLKSINYYPLFEHSFIILEDGKIFIKSCIGESFIINSQSIFNIIEDINFSNFLNKVKCEENKCIDYIISHTKSFSTDLKLELIKFLLMNYFKTFDDKLVSKALDLAYSIKE
jgi:hypothetical protein